MTEAEFQREDRACEDALDYREELEREDIVAGAVSAWRKSQRIAVRFAGTPHCTSECGDTKRHTLACLRSAATAARETSTAWLPLHVGRKRRAA
jgi:hypothetical protein